MLLVLIALYKPKINIQFQKLFKVDPPLKYVFLNISASNGQNSLIFCRELQTIWGYLSTDFEADRLRSFGRIGKKPDDRFLILYLLIHVFPGSFLALKVSN